MPTNEEVYEALSILQSLCKSHKDCIDCPLYRPFCEESCGLRYADDIPQDWKIQPVKDYCAFG